MKRARPIVDRARGYLILVSLFRASTRRSAGPL